MDDRGFFRREDCRRQIFAALAFALFSCTGYADPKLKFDIPSDQFPKAILEFYYQSKVEVLFLSNDALYHIYTQPVVGVLEPRDALERMLKGTPLTFEFDGPHSVIIRQPNPDVAAASSAKENYDAVLVTPRSYDICEPTNESTDIPAACLHHIALDEVLISSTPVGGLITDSAEPPLQTFDRPAIDYSGATTVQDFAGTIPQVWAGGPNEYSQLGREGLTNSTNGTGFNYHSLGAESAVVLVDGMRPAKSGTEAGWWDISLLPLSALQRIEIAPEGASNRYGSDAVSAVVNFVTRSDFQGAESEAEVGGTTGGGGNERRVSQLLGKRSGGFDASLILDYYDRDAIPAADRAQATSDLRRWGGTNWNSLYGYPGTLMTESGQTWAITGVANGKPVLGAAGSSNNYDQWQSRDVLAWQRHLSALGHLSKRLGGASLWSSVWLSERHTTALLGVTNGTTLSIPSTNPGYINPMAGSDPVYVQYGVSNLLGPTTNDTTALSGNVAAGITYEKQNWTLGLSGQTGLERDRLLLGGYANSSILQQALLSDDPANVVNPFLGPNAVNPAVLAEMDQIYYYQSYSRLQLVEATANRALQGSPGGDGSLSFGAQWRQESLETFNPAMAPGPTRQIAERDIGSVYASVNLPLIGTKQAIPLVEGLDLFVGARKEHYSDGETATSPAVALAWSPSSTLTVRGTFRRAFRPPALTETSTASNISETAQLSDGRIAIAEIGGNPALRAERARIWTGGLDFRPSERLRLGATYYSVKSTGRVFQPTFAADPDSFNGKIIPNPTAAQMAAVCGESRFLGGTTESCERTPVNLVMDLRLQSLEYLTTSGADLSAMFVGDHWKLRFDGTYLFSYRGTGLNGLVLERLDTLNNPVDLRARATAARVLGPVTVSISGSFTDGYKDTISAPERRIGSWTTVDLVASYEPGPRTILGRGEVFLRVQNLMNRQPPFANNGADAVGWDPENGGNLAGRIISGEIRWTW